METIMSKTNDTSREELTINKLDTVSGGDVLDTSREELTINELDAVSGGDALLSNVSKTRSEISMTFARNSRA
jgi:bacteriocin-like protein